MSETVENTLPEQPQAQSGLTIADLIMVAQVVQRGASAGIFKADEFKSIGDFYDRLIKFLDTAGAIVRQDAAQPAAPESAPQGE